MRYVLLFALGSVVACVGSDPTITSPAALENDAGAPASDPGTSGGASRAPDAGRDAPPTVASSFGLKLDVADVTVLEGAETTVKVLLTRSQFEAGVTVTASGLASGVTIAPIDIGAGGNEGTLTIKAGFGAAHGITTVSIKGVGAGATDQTAELKVLVRGAPGTFDKSFGTAGKATGSGSVTGLALQADGKLVVVGNAGTETFIARHTEDGKPDLAFGGTGRVSIPDLATATDVVVRADGKIFVAGNHPNGNTPYFAVTRFSEGGTVDSGFGEKGTRAFPWPGAFSSNANAIGLDAAGNVVVSGYRFDGTAGDYNFAVLRLTGDDGHLDKAFSGDGFDDVDFGGLDFAYGLAVKPDGTVVIAGGGDAPNAFAIARFLPGGTPDPGLKGSGHTTLAFPSTKISAAQAVAIQSDNKMIAAGYLTPNAGLDEPVIVRFEAGGTPDPNFGTGGSTITSVSAGADRFASVAVQPDGAIVVAGFTQPGDATTSEFLVARYTPAGVLDKSFATTGIVKTAFGGEGDVAIRVVLQPDGRIVVAGNTGTSNYGVARYWP